MAATVKVKISLEMSGLSTKDETLATSFTVDTTPEEFFHGYSVIGSTTTNLDLGDIDDTDLLGILIIAKGTADTDYLGILPNDVGTGVPSTAAGNITLNAGEAVFLSFDGSTQGLTNAYYIRVKGSAATTAVEYFAFGKHT